MSLLVKVYRVLLYKRLHALERLLIKKVKTNRYSLNPLNYDADLNTEHFTTVQHINTLFLLRIF